MREEGLILSSDIVQIVTSWHKYVSREKSFYEVFACSIRLHNYFNIGGHILWV